jgi:hypothetical protein
MGPKSTFQAIFSKLLFITVNLDLVYISAQIDQKTGQFASSDFTRGGVHGTVDNQLVRRETVTEVILEKPQEVDLPSITLCYDIVNDTNLRPKSCGKFDGWQKSHPIQCLSDILQLILIMSCLII